MALIAGICAGLLACRRLTAPVIMGGGRQWLCVAGDRRPSDPIADYAGSPHVGTGMDSDRNVRLTMHTMREGRPTGMVAVLFTDLVGSTDLLARLGEANFDRVRRGHFADLRHAIARMGGEEIKTLGDGILAVFGSATDAVDCAAAMQREVDRQTRLGPAAVAIRIGIALGDVSFEEDDVFGTPVVEAARLVSAAGGGQILVTDLVRRVAGGRSAASFSDGGPMDLKGLPQPVITCEVVWERDPAAPPPLSAQMSATGRVFVARHTELDRLEQLWKQSVAGERRIAVLAGEPGIGKTRLSAEFASSVHSTGAVVLSGRCDEDLGVPYQPFVEALGHFVAFTPEAELPRRLGRYGGELARLAPDLADRVPGLAPPLHSDPETERYRLFDAVAVWLAGASMEAPVLLVLDDLQWAAKPTLLLLRHVLRSAEPARLLVVAAYRDTELGRGHPLTELLANLRRDGTLERIPLSGLDHAGVVAFMEQAAGHDLDDGGLALAGAISAETEGNPFFVAELLRHLAQTGAITRRAGRWETRALVEELGIPEGVRDLIGQRLSRLSEAANRILGLAAVAGQEFEPAVLHVASGLDEEAVLSALEEGSTARLLDSEAAGRFRFSHALVRATLYEELSDPRKVVLHRKVAEAIETLHANRLDDYLPALSHHFSRAAAPTTTTAKAVAYTARAGDRALDLLAHDEAVAYYRHALDLVEASESPTDDEHRLALLMALGEAQRRAGDPGHRQTFLDAGGLAKERGDAEALARAALANTRGSIFSSVGQVDTERVDALEAALEIVGEHDSPVRARLLASLSQELVFAGDWEHCLHLSDASLEIGRRISDDFTLAEVLIARYHAIAVPSTLAERVANTLELLAVAERLGDPLVMSRALWLGYRAALESGDVNEARRYHARSEQLSADLGQPTLRWFDAWNRDGLALLAGRVEEAERLVQSAFDLGQEIGQPDNELFGTLQRFQVRFEQGRLDEMEGDLAALATKIPGFPLLRATQALLYSQLNRDDEARSMFEELAKEDFSRVPLDVYWLRTITDTAAVCSHLRDAARSTVLFDLLAPYADQLIVAIRLVTGTVTHYLGILATTMERFEEAETCFTEAQATHARIDAPAWLSRTRLEWTRMLVARSHPGDIDRARDLVRQVIANARDLSLTSLERQAVALIGELS